MSPVTFLLTATSKFTHLRTNLTLHSKVSQSQHTAIVDVHFWFASLKKGKFFIKPFITWLGKIRTPSSWHSGPMQSWLGKVFRMYVPVLHETHFSLPRSLFCRLGGKCWGGCHDYSWCNGAGRGGADLVGLHVSWGSCRDTEHDISTVTALSHMLWWATTHLSAPVISPTVHPGPQIRRDSHHLGHHHYLRLSLLYAKFWAFLLKKSSLVLGNLTGLAVQMYFFLPCISLYFSGFRAVLAFLEKAGVTVSSYAPNAFLEKE